MATTTFKKESFIKHNISLVNQSILSSGEDIANHFNMHVVDNGRTLDVEKLTTDTSTFILTTMSAGRADSLMA